MTFNADFLELSIPQKHRPVVLFQTDADWLIFLILVKLWSNLSNNLVVGSKTTNIVMGRLIIMAKPKIIEKKFRLNAEEYYIRILNMFMEE